MLAQSLFSTASQAAEPLAACSVQRHTVSDCRTAAVTASDGTDSAMRALERDAEWFGTLAAQAQARYEREHCLSAAGDRDRWLIAQREARAKLQGAIR